jgi:hypothetical protein
MKAAVKRKPTQRVTFGDNLAVEELRALTAELQSFRSYPPLVRRGDGTYEGDILGFVKGLRLSARLIYFLRNRLSSTDLEVSWGHLVANSQSCSPECDVIIHAKGHVGKWNGSDHPIMDFKFVEAKQALAVISCKSSLKSIDTTYPKKLKKFGVDAVFLFAECCGEKQFERLEKRALAAGYRGLWCLYLVQDGGPFTTPETMYIDFGRAVLEAVAP